MAYSGTNSYRDTAITLIKDALILCGGLEENETPSDEQLAHSMRTLNRLVKAWSVKGLKVWTQNQETLTLVQAQSSYNIGPTGTDKVTEEPIDVSNVRVQVSTSEIYLNELTREEYMRITDKTAQGTPVQYYWDRQLDNRDLYLSLIHI